MKNGGDGRRGYRNLQEELDQIKAIVGSRPFGMSEGNWNTNKIYRWEGDVWKALDKILPEGWLSWTLTDEQCRDNWSKDAKIARAAGCAFYIWYQVNESEGSNSGLRRYPWSDFNWKPEANIPLL